MNPPEKFNLLKQVKQNDLRCEKDRLKNQLRSLQSSIALDLEYLEQNDSIPSSSIANPAIEIDKLVAKINELQKLVDLLNE